ncbi:MAG TPA: outer membrane lipoprotein carrier protein LolA [Xanthobacteraceae bacterium]|jgi:outer membrane lipoprotein-sorting protein|nr:outer membrane lipoprotein carrier protein LolA [Xanthobacteraceae bacterium]
MAPKRLARSGLIAIAPILRRAPIGLCCGTIVAIAVAILVAPLAMTRASADPVVSENVPLPVPAPLPKTGTAAPPAAAAKPATNDKAANDKSANDKPATETRQTPSLFPFSALFGNKSSTAPAAPEPPSPFDAKQRALLDRISAYLSNLQTVVGKFVQVGPDGGRTEGTFYMQKPGRVRFQYNPPSPIDIISDGSSVVVRDRKLATQDLYPLSQTPLRYLLAERIDLLRDTDVVSVGADDSFATVVIEQKQILIGTDRLMIMFDAKDLTLKQWTVTDPQGFDTTVAVYNLDSTKKPDPNLFVINYQREQTGVQ